MLLAAAGLIGLAIFAADLLSPLQGAVAVLYIIVILLVAQGSGRRRAVFATGLGCAALAFAAFAGDHMGDPFDAAYVRLAVSLVAIAATTLLAIEQLRAEAERRRAEQRYREARTRSMISAARLPLATIWSRQSAASARSGTARPSQRLPDLP